MDLELLVQHFSHITLVDIDGATLRDAVKARGFAENKQITVVGDADLTGVNALLTKCKSDFSAENIEQVKTASKGFKIAELKQYDVVASTCLLSQLQNHVFISVGDRDQATFAELLAMTRQRHLELLLELTVAGGKAVLITDLTSSEAIPELKTTGLEIPRSIWDKIYNGNHFHGMSPISFNNDIKHLRSEGQIAEFQMAPPWLWNASVRLYACIGYCLSKA